MLPYARRIDDKYTAKVCTIDPTEKNTAIEVVKTEAGKTIPHDEPLFLFRAKDQLSIAALMSYARRCKEAGCDDAQLNGINIAIERFRSWQGTNPSKVRIPD